jgi:DNA-binding transcriptional MerR regulator
MQHMYTAKQSAAIYGVSSETIRTWSEEFSDYLGPTANPGRGRGRSFAQSDMEVFSLISEMKQQNYTYADIHVALKSGERGTPPDIDPKEVQQLITTEGERRMMLQIENLQRELTKAYQERDKALQQAQRTQELEIENARLQERLDAVSQQLEDAKSKMDDMDELREHVGELRGELKAVMRQMGQGDT